MKKKFYRAYRLRTRTKIEISLVTFFLVSLIIAVSVGSVNRTISNTHDDINTFIRNSNGNYWDATGSNLQAAIDDLGSNGGIVWLPNATIYTKVVWINGSNITLMGQNTRIRENTFTLAGLTPIDGMGIISVQADYTTIDGIEVDGAMAWMGSTYPTYGSVNLNGIWLKNVEHCVIRNCEVHHINDQGIEMEGIYNCSILNNYVHHCGNVSDYSNIGGSGIRCDSSWPMCYYNVIQNNRVHHCREHGIKIYESDSYPYLKLHNKVLNNHVSYCNMGDWDESGYPYGYGIVIPSCYNLIEGNTVLMNKWMEIGISARSNNIVKNNVIIQDADSTHQMLGIGDNCIVSGNYLDGNEFPPWTSSHVGIKCSDVQNTVIVNNIIKNVRMAIQLYGKVENATGNSIMGNVLVGNSLYLKTDAGYTVKDNIIMGNDLSGLDASPPIQANGVHGGNNTIKDNIGYDYSSYQYIPADTSNPYQYRSPSAGAMWFNTTTNELGIYNGTSWIWK